MSGKVRLDLVSSCHVSLCQVRSGYIRLFHVGCGKYRSVQVRKYSVRLNHVTSGYIRLGMFLVRID